MHSWSVNTSIKYHHQFSTTGLHFALIPDEIFLIFLFLCESNCKDSIDSKYFSVRYAIYFNFTRFSYWFHVHSIWCCFIRHRKGSHSPPKCSYNPCDWFVFGDLYIVDQLNSVCHFHVISNNQKLFPFLF